jgi:hypothetical protein
MDSKLGFRDYVRYWRKADIELNSPVGIYVALLDGSVGSCAAELDHLSPFFRFLGDLLCRFGGRSAQHRCTKRAKPTSAFGRKADITRASPNVRL